MCITVYKLLWIRNCIFTKQCILFKILWLCWPRVFSQYIYSTVQYIISNKNVNRKSSTVPGRYLYDDPLWVWRWPRATTTTPHPLEGLWHKQNTITTTTKYNHDNNNHTNKIQSRKQHKQNAITTTTKYSHDNDNHTNKIQSRQQHKQNAITTNTNTNKCRVQTSMVEMSLTWPGIAQFKLKM